MEAVGAAASIVAIIDLSAKVASATFQYSKDVKSAGDDIRRLRGAVNDLRNASTSVGQLLDLPEGKRLEASQQLLNTTNDSKLQLERIYERLRPKTARQAMSRLRLRALKWPFESKEVAKTVQDLVGYTQTMNLALQVDQTTILLGLEQQAVLARLEAQVATGASFDSRAEQHNSRCLPNTRVALLQQISEWAGNPSAESVFWLNGMAGTGKSTISRTITEIFEREGRLGASFFFKRGETDRSSTAKFFPTVAADLARRDPAIARHVKGAIEDDAIFHKALPEQFNKLIFRPLSMIQRKEPFVIIVDALDECDEEGDIKLMINLFSRAQTLRSVQLKVVVTSRPDLPIRLGFTAIEGKYHDLVLHDIPEPVVEHDISIFLETELAKIRDEYNASVTDNRQLAGGWPGQSCIQTLVRMAVPLFIFAATACLFIADRKCGNPDQQLKEVLSFQQLPEGSQMDATYLPVLNKLIVGLPKKRRDMVLREFRAIVGSIVILGRPLSTSALAQLLNIQRDVIDTRLDLLHSVLSIPSSAESPIRLLHLSFRDFLLDPEKMTDNPFWIDKTKMHITMAENCLRVMSCLRQDICQLGAPGTRRSAIDPQKINTHLPAELQYACLYWVYHIQSAGSHDGDGHQVYGFLKRCFLYWIEALSLMGRVRESLHLIKVLQSLYKDQDDIQLSEFLNDAERFIFTNVSTIDNVPLQLYSSLLTFTPEMSKVRITFQDQVANWIPLKPWVEKTWTQALQTLEGHSSLVLSVAFSPDGALIVSASDDRTVRLCRATTGECIQTLEGHSGLVNSAVFSPDGALIASASFDKTVRLWRAATGEYIQTLEGHSGSVLSAAFSPDGALIASASYDKTVRLWRAATGECIQTLEGHSGSVHSAVFSPDGALIASASFDKTVRLWRAATGECIQTLKGHSGSVLSAVFSPDGALIVSASYDEKVRLWHAATGEYIQTLKGHSDSVLSVVFSPDGALIASASFDKTVRLWRAATGKCIQTLEGHSSLVFSVAFSPDGALITSASSDETVRLWRAATGECIQTLEGHSGSVYSAVFSPDGALIVSASSDETVRLWRAATGECIQTLEGHSGSVLSAAFSPDRALIASASYDKTVRLWRAATGECVQNEYLGLVSTYVSFEPDTEHLLTDAGAISLRVDSGDPTTQVQSTMSRPGLGISQDLCWMTWNEENFFWLPKDFRPSCSAILGSTVVVGSSLGKVIVMRFSLSQLTQLFSK